MLSEHFAKISLGLEVSLLSRRHNEAKNRSGEWKNFSQRNNLPIQFVIASIEEVKLPGQKIIRKYIGKREEGTRERLFCNQRLYVWHQGEIEDFKFIVTTISFLSGTVSSVAEHCIVVEHSGEQN